MIKILSPHDVAAWKQIRLEGLLESPQAFGESYEVELKKTDAEQSDQLRKSAIYAYLDESGEILGVLGFYVTSVTKARHRGNLFCMYVRPQHRGMGIGSKLIDKAVEYAKTKVQQLHLSVVTDNDAAIALYKKYGFSIYGTEPRALCVDGIYYDEYLMVRILSDN
jgi:ribosomal protein S18 acetylase RimI-like enzyme